MNMIIDIFIALGVGIALFFLGNFYHDKIAIKISKQRRLLLKIMSLIKTKDSKVAIIYGCVTPQRDSDAFFLEQGDFSAIIKSKDIIGKVFPTSKQDFLPGVNLCPDLLNYENIFSISGPKWNPITAKIINDLGCPVEFDFERRIVRVINNITMKSIEYETKKIDGELATECYGIILSGSIKKAGSALQKVIVCAGRTTISTYSCVSYLNYLSCSKNEIKKLIKKGINSNTNWCILLRTRRLQQENKGTNIPLHDVDVSIDVVQIFHQDDFLNS